MLIHRDKRAYALRQLYVSVLFGYALPIHLLEQLLPTHDLVLINRKSKKTYASLHKSLFLTAGLYLSGSIQSGKTPTLLNAMLQRYYLTALLSVLLCFMLSPVLGQHWQWANSIVGSNRSHSSRIVLDDAGNSYIVGTVVGSANFGDFTIDSGARSSACIVKYDAEGNILWTKLLKSGFGSGGYSLGIDGQGNIFITGHFTHSVSLDHLTLTGSGAVHMFIAKLDTNGKAIWAKQLGNHTSGAYGYLRVNPIGDIYIIGGFQGRIAFDGIILESVNSCLFIAKYSNNGQVLWVKKYNVTGSPLINGIALDENGNSYIIGSFLGTANFGNYTLTSDDNFTGDIFIAKFDMHGNVQWADKAAGTAYSESRDIAVDKAGNCYITGGFTKTARFGDKYLSSYKGNDGFDSKDIYLAKYNPDGQALWATKWGGPSNENSNAIALDATGNIYLTGDYFWSGADLGKWHLCGNSSVNMFVAKINAEAELQWAIGPGGSDYESPRSIAVDATGNCHITGIFNETGEFGLISIGNSTREEINTFTAKLDVSSFVTPGLATQSLTQTVFCPGASLEVPFVMTGNSTSCNVFVAQLSDAKGLFTNPTIIGTAKESPIKAVIPARMPAGTGYRLRVVSSSPVLSGTDNGVDLTIDAIPAAPKLTAVASGCAPGASILKASGATEEQLYRWYTEAQGGIAIAEAKGDTYITPTLSSPATYFGVVVSKAGCESKRTAITVGTTIAKLEAAAFSNQCGLEDYAWGLAPLELNFINSSTGAVGYLWEFGDGATAAEPEPSHLYEQPGEYSIFLTAYYADGCRERKRIAMVDVKERKPIPNVITPDGTGKNEQFVVQFTCSPLHLKVYNRLGKLVYDQPNYANSWNGADLAVGTYYYQLSAANGQSWKGWIQIIR